MVDYFKVLGVSETADRNQIKSAYRELAKEWHPDRNDHKDAAAAFILINEAYAFLIDDDRRQSYRIARVKVKDDRLQRERERRYREWVERSQEQVRKRAANHARNSYENFEKSRYYRTMMLMDRIYDYIFLGLSSVILVVPVIVILRPEEDRDPLDSTSIISMGLTFAMGSLFIYFIWKYLIRKPQEA